MPTTSIGSTGVTFPDNSLQSAAAMGTGATTNAVGSSAITLTSSSTQYQVAQINSAANSIVNLPNATTLTVKGSYPFVIENRSPIGANLSIKDAGGTVVGYIPVGYIGVISLKDNSTSAGTWAVNQVQPQTFTNWDGTSLTTSALQASTTFWGIVGLSATSFVRISYTTSIAATTSYSTYYLQAATISGSTITFGSIVNFQYNIAGGTSSFASTPQVIRLSNTAFVIKSQIHGYQGGCGVGETGGSGFRVCTVSGTTITIGSNSNASLPNSGGSASSNGAIANAGNGMICRLSDTTFAVVYNTATTDSYSPPYNYSGNLTCNIVSVSGTTMTVGTKVDLGTSTYTQPISLVALSSTSLFVCYAQSASAGATTGRNKMVIVSVSGTTPTWGTPVTIESADTGSFMSIFAYSYYGTSMLYDTGVAPSSSQVVFNTGYTVAEGTVSGTTPTYDSAPSNSVVWPLYLSTSSKALGGTSTSGLTYLNIQTGGFVKTTNAINVLPASYGVTPVALNPLGAQPTTALIGYTTASGGATVILGTAQ